MNEIPLDIKFPAERLRRYLKENPDDANRLAIAHFEDFSMLAIEFKKLEIQRQALEIENIKLKSAKTHRTVSLPSFVSDRGVR